MFDFSCYPTCLSYSTHAGKKSESSNRMPSPFSGISPLVSLAPPPAPPLDFDRVVTLPSSHAAMEASLWFEIPSVIDLLALLFSDFPTYTALCDFHDNNDHEAFFGVFLSTCHTLKANVMDPLYPRRYDYKDIIYLYHLHQALKKESSHFFESHVTPYIENLLRELTAELTSSQKGRLVRCLNLLHSEKDTSADELRSSLRPYLYSASDNAAWLSNHRVLSEIISMFTVEQYDNNTPDLREVLTYCQCLLHALTEGHEVQLSKFWIARDKASLTPMEIIESLTSSAVQNTLSKPKPTELVLLLSSTIEWLLPTTMKIEATSKLRLIVQDKQQLLLMPCLHAISFPDKNSLEQQKASNQIHKLELTFLSTSAVTLLLEKLRPYVSPFTPLPQSKRQAASFIPTPTKRTKVREDLKLFSTPTPPLTSATPPNPSEPSVSLKSNLVVPYEEHTLFIPKNPHESIKELLEFCNKNDRKQTSSKWLIPLEGKAHLSPEQLLALDPAMRLKTHQSKFSTRRLLALTCESPQKVHNAFQNGLFSPNKPVVDINDEVSKEREIFFETLALNFKDFKNFPAHRDVCPGSIGNSFNPFLFVNYSSLQGVLFDLSAEIMEELKLDLNRNREVFFTNLAYRLIKSCKKRALNLYLTKDNVKSFLIDHNTFDWAKPGANQRQFPNEPVLIFTLLNQLTPLETEILEKNLNPGSLDKKATNKRIALVLRLLKEMGAAIQNRYFLNPLPQFNGFPRRLSNLPLIKLLEGEAEEKILADNNLNYSLSEKDSSFTEDFLKKIPSNYK